MGKYLGIDFGQKQVGIALTDEEKKYAFAENTIKYKEIKELLEEIKDICQAEEVEKIILGLPINLKGEKTPWTKEVEGFSKRLRNKLGMDCHFQDERLTSKMSESLFKKERIKKRLSKAIINAESARIILQDYLDRMSLS